MLLKQVKSDYDQKMFESRTLISKSGFFDHLLSAINDLILEEHSKNELAEGRILDAGCGEGSHLAKILMNLNEVGITDWLGFGVDISKKAIRAASKEYPKYYMVRGRLGKTAFQKRTIRHYAEYSFTR